MYQISIIVIVILISSCNQSNESKSDKIQTPSDTAVKVDESLDLLIAKHGDTVYKHFIDPDSTKGDNFDDSYNVKSVYKTIKNDTTIKSNLFFIEDEYKVFFEPTEIISFCDNSINEIKKGKSFDFDEKSFVQLKSFAKSYSSGQGVKYPFDYDWLPALLLNCKFYIINIKSGQRPKAMIIEYYNTEFSGGKNFYLLTPKGDTLSFIHDMDWIS